MGPEDNSATTGEFTDKIPPSFNGRNNYASYREDVMLWVNLTSLAEEKKGPALVGRLGGEAKASAKTISLENICAADGVERLLKHLDKSYAIDAANQLDADLALFLDYTWKKSMSVEQYIAGFHSRLDKISTLQLDNKLKGHLLLRQAALAPQDRNMLVGAASGSYDVQHLTAALRNAYMNQTPVDTSLTTQGSTASSHNEGGRARQDRRNDNRVHGRQPGQSQNNTIRPTFYTFKTSSSTSGSDGAILDSGACASVVGKETLDKMIRAMGLEGVPDGTPSRDQHRFGNHSEVHRTICAVKFPFTCSDEHGSCVASFDIVFDVINGELPFLIGLPSLLSMRATLNFRYKSLGLHIGTNYMRIRLEHCDSHIILPFSSKVKRVERDGKASSTGSDCRYTTCIRTNNATSCYQPSDDSSSTFNATKCAAITRSGFYYPGGSVPPASKDGAIVSSCIPVLYAPTPAPDTAATPGSQDDVQKDAQAIDQSQLENQVDPRSDPSPNSWDLSTTQLDKLHVQLKHATHAQMRSYLRCAGIWNDTMERRVTDVVKKCRCRLAFPPESHAVVGPTPPSEDIQVHLSIDVISLEGVNYIHCVDRVSGWSEIGALSRRGLDEQVKVFRRIQLNRHGIPKTVIGDREYNKGAFQSLCDENRILLIPTPAHAHECNGAIERANRTVRSRFDRLRVCDQRAPASELVQEAVFGKNTNRGNRLASSFEIIFSRSPRLSGLDLPFPSSIPTMQEYNAHIARRKIRSMLRSNVRDHDIPDVGDRVYIWRDDSGWIGPASVLKKDDYGVEVSHNGRTKSASMNRVRRLGAVGQEPISQPPTNSSVADQGITEVPKQMLPYDVDAGSIPLDWESDDDDHATDDQNQPIGDNPRNAPSVIPLSPSAPAPLHETSTSSDPPGDSQPDSDQIQSAPQNDTRPRHPISSREVRALLADKDAYLNQPIHLRTGVEVSSLENDREPHNDATHLTCDDQKTLVPARIENVVRNTSQPFHNLGDDTCSDTPPSPNFFVRPFQLARTPDSIVNVDQERIDAYNREYRAWVTEDAFERVDRSSVPREANVIGSHALYKRKDDGSMKARIVPWGHRDEERNSLRSDSPCANLEVFRLIMSLAAEHAWPLGQMDISTAFLQASGFKRAVFVKPPKEAKDPNGLWKLKAAAYGLVDSGRLWYRTSDHALVSEHKLTRSRYEPTLYYKRVNGELAFALVAQVDNYIYCGTEAEIRSFEDFLQQRFSVGALDRHEFAVMGCEITQDSTGTVRLTQRDRLHDIDERALTVPRNETGRSPDRNASPHELHAYRSVIGKMLYVGRMSQPVMLYHASHMATKVGDLKAHHLKDLRALLKFDKKHTPALCFLKPSSGSKFSLEAISDAAMSPISEGGGRGAHIIIRRNGDVSHPIYWSARKLRRVARSSSTAELLSASDAASSLIYLQHLMEEFVYHHEATMVVDSRALLNLSTSIREPAEAANKIDLAFIRENFTPRAISTIAWTPGYYNVADGLTKDNRTSASLLLGALRSGVHPRHPDLLAKSAEPEFEPNGTETPTGHMIDDGADDQLSGGCWRKDVDDKIGDGESNE